MERIEMKSDLRSYSLNLKELKDTFTRVNALGQNSLQSTESDYDEMISALSHIVHEEFVNIDDLDLKAIYNTYHNFYNFIQVTAGIPDNEFVVQRPYLFKTFYQHYSQFKKNVSPFYISNIAEKKFTATSKIIDQAVNKLTDYNNKNEELINSLKEAEKFKNDLQKDVEEFRNETSDFRNKIKLVDQSNIFNNKAITNKKDADFWIRSLIGSLIIFIILIFYIKNNFCFDLSCFEVSKLSEYKGICEECGQNLLWMEMLKSILFRLLLISINIYLISFCVKNYNASMHNKTINDHRHNSLAAAFHFHNYASEGHKDEILSKAADAIFTHQRTGYNSKSSEPSNPITQVINKATGISGD